MYSYNMHTFIHIEAIKLLHNAMGVGGIYGSARINVTNVYGPMLLALCGGWVSHLPKKVLHNTSIVPHIRLALESVRSVISVTRGWVSNLLKTELRDTSMAP